MYQWDSGQFGLVVRVMAQRLKGCGFHSFAGLIPGPSHVCAGGNQLCASPTLMSLSLSLPLPSTISKKLNGKNIL